MKLKKLFLILSIFLISGCSVKYNITINEDTSINEKAIVEIDDTDDNYEKVSNLFSKNKIPKKNYKISRLSNVLEITYKKDYESIEEYILESKVYKQAFSEILLNKDQNKTSIDTSANFTNNNLSINKDNDLNFDNLTINVNSKLPIISSNADKIKNNTYIWEYDGISKAKNISIVLNNKSSMLTYSSVLIIAVILVSGSAIGLIIYNRFKESNRF